MPSMLERAIDGRGGGSSRGARSSVRMCSARHEASPVSRRSRPSRRCAGRRGSSRCAPCSRRASPARGYSTPSTFCRASRYFGSRVCARVVAVVADEEVPPHRLVLGGEGVEGGHVVVVGQAAAVGSLGRCVLEVSRVAAGLEQEHRAAGLGQPGGERPAAGAGADDDVVALRLSDQPWLRASLEGLQELDQRALVGVATGPALPRSGRCRSSGRG